MTEAVCRKEGEYWTIIYEGKVFRLRDTKGLGYLSQLLRSPGGELTVTRLAATVPEGISETSSIVDPRQAERVRLNVTRAIRSTLTKIGAQDPALGDHLRNTVRMGNRCAYHPDPRVPIRWSE